MTHLGVGVNLESSNRSIESGDFGNVVILALALLLLELEGDTTDGSLLDALHQVGGEARDFVAQALGGNGSLLSYAQHKHIRPSLSNLSADTHDFIDNALVGVEIEGQAGVAVRIVGSASGFCAPSMFSCSLFLDEDTGGPFGGFGTNATLGGHRINISASWVKLAGRIPW